jgi:septal ring factor EnvC (AmiA/AmiB activator)
MPLATIAAEWYRVFFQSLPYHLLLQCKVTLLWFVDKQSKEFDHVLTKYHTIHTAEWKLWTIVRNLKILKARVEFLEKENVELRRENVELKHENAELRKQVLELQRENAELRKQVLELQRENAELRKQVITLQNVCDKYFNLYGPLPAN